MAKKVANKVAKKAATKKAATKKVAKKKVVEKASSGRAGFKTSWSWSLK
jgi:hypothetical protein